MVQSMGNVENMPASCPVARAVATLRYSAGLVILLEAEFASNKLFVAVSRYYGALSTFSDTVQCWSTLSV